MDLILLHGAIGAAVQLDPLACSLHGDFIVHNLDLKGHGADASSQQPYTIPAFAENILDYMDGKKIEKAAIFGYSMGGYVGTYMAAHHSDRVLRLATLGTKYQ